MPDQTGGRWGFGRLNAGAETGSTGRGAARGGPAAGALLAHVRRLHVADTLGDDFSFLEVRF
jgi:hypothetical protein